MTLQSHSTGVFTLDVYGGRPDWEVNVEAAREAGSEIEKAVEKSLSYCLTAISGSVLLSAGTASA